MLYLLYAMLFMRYHAVLCCAMMYYSIHMLCNSINMITFNANLYILKCYDNIVNTNKTPRPLIGNIVDMWGYLSMFYI